MPRLRALTITVYSLSGLFMEAGFTNMVISRSRSENGNPNGVTPLENVHLSFYTTIYEQKLYQKIFVDWRVFKIMV
jgi:hypothetical protein